MERSILSWKEPFEVGKLEMKLERYVVVGKTICSWKDIDVVGKIRLGVELGWSRRISLQIVFPTTKYLSNFISSFPTSSGSFQLRIDLSN